MKVLGQDLIDFFHEWPMGPDTYYEECSFEELPPIPGETLTRLFTTNEDGDAREPVDPTRRYPFDGVLGWQGKEDPPPGWTGDMCVAFKRWKKARTSCSFGVTIPKKQADEFEAFCKSKNWKLTKS